MLLIQQQGKKVCVLRYFWDKNDLVTFHCLRGDTHAWSKPAPGMRGINATRSIIQFRHNVFMMLPTESQTGTSLQT